MRYEFKNKYLSVLSNVFNGEKYYFFKEPDKVVILPYAFTQSGLSIIALVEPISIWGRDSELTAVQGSKEEGENPHDCAVRELLEETGFHCPYNDKEWTFIGKYHYTKSSVSKRYYFLVDISNSEKIQKTTDGSEFERMTSVVVSSPKMAEISSDMQLHFLVKCLIEKLSANEQKPNNY